MFFGILPLLLGTVVPTITAETSCPSSSGECSTLNNGVEFLYLRQNLTFEAARQQCKALNFTDLAILDTQEKACLVEEFLQSHPPIYQDTWVGLYYFQNVSLFRWLDGSELGWTSWISRGNWQEPDSVTISPCVRIRNTLNNTWGTMNCSARLGALCQRDVSNRCSSESRLPMTRSCFTLMSSDVDIVDQSATTYMYVRSVLDCAERCVENCCQYFLFGLDACKVLASGINFTTSSQGTRLYKRQIVQLWGGI